MFVPRMFLSTWCLIAVTQVKSVRPTIHVQRSVCVSRRSSLCQGVSRARGGRHAQLRSGGRSAASCLFVCFPTIEIQFLLAPMMSYCLTHAMHLYRTLLYLGYFHKRILIWPKMLEYMQHILKEKSLLKTSLEGQLEFQHSFRKSVCCSWASGHSIFLAPF